MLLVILDAKKLSEHFMKKNCKKISLKNEFKTENVKKRKGHKLYVRHKGYENSFNKKDQ